MLTICASQTNKTVSDEIDSLTELIKEQEDKENIRSFLFFKGKPDKFLIDKWLGEIKALRDCVKHFEAQNMKPRCLTCGSYRVVEANLASESGIATRTGVMHHCGGEIISVMRGRVSFGNLPRVTYNMRGDILRDERFNT